MKHDLILLIGPSAVGKSTVLKQLRAHRLCNVSYLSLDQVVGQYSKKRHLIGPGASIKCLVQLFKNNPDGLFRYCLQALNNALEKICHNSKVLVDVGAGLFYGEAACRWVAQQRSIYMAIDQKQGFIRFSEFRNSTLSYQQYLNTQFSFERRQLYASCQIAIDCTDLSVVQATNSLIAELNITQEFSLND
ncbi:hypothetical protein R7127_25510 [Vibrio sp. 1159]|uniref:hypothetical protein n=1 Tax=Vibrio sp. 1159 TaxID=3074545 RepID=UPI0029654091|nr:hypothetical protein [Vibrio sp. 1159]MDW2323623.1 hypothetical protein [Vibrio sp. 1159]